MTEPTAAPVEPKGWRAAAERVMPFARRVPVLRRIAAWRDGAVELQAVRPESERLARLVAHYESQLFVVPGHFYSPSPDLDDLNRRHGEIFRHGRVPLPGVDLNEEAQVALLDELAPLAAEIGLPEQSVNDWRYHSDNEGFGPADGITLASVLRLWQPSRYVEIGSGWTSALALDINDHFLDGAMKTTFIDPYPERLLGLLRPEDHDRAEIRVEPVQAIDLAVFDVLGPGDVLFIDSTHVARTGGDVVHDVFTILPRLASGVRVHFHDMFYPFEYPAAWVFEGRAWNELYLIRALLSDSTRYRIALWPSMLSVLHTDRLAAALPTAMPYGGGSLWLEVR
ncbi:MAG TPA: class I SAM-dependent methyltransferase [Ilumatobacteraceae bacterium]|nr:class I SAM-dependent methyltransferase [Ilumatobacteraceae bacterium]